MLCTFMGISSANELLLPCPLISQVIQSMRSLLSAVQRVFRRAFLHAYRIPDSEQQISRLTLDFALCLLLLPSTSSSGALFQILWPLAKGIVHKLKRLLIVVILDRGTSINRTFEASFFGSSHLGKRLLSNNPAPAPEHLNFSRAFPLLGSARIEEFSRNSLQVS